MKATELRLGNWVNTPRQDQNPFRIDLFEYLLPESAKVGMNVFEYELPGLGTMPGHPLTWELEDLSPIELTTEILIKSGFELKYGWLWKLYYDDIMNPITLRHITNNKFLKDEPLEKLFFRWDQHIDVYYVHQLQNLYFALTGTELDIKL